MHVVECGRLSLPTNRGCALLKPDGSQYNVSMWHGCRSLAQLARRQAGRPTHPHTAAGRWPHGVPMTCRSSLLCPEALKVADGLEVAGDPFLGQHLLRLEALPSEWRLMGKR